MSKKKSKTIVFRGEVISGKIPEYMYDAIMPLIFLIERDYFNATAILY